MLSFNQTNVMQMLLLVTMSLGINGLYEGEPYGIGFYHSDTSLPSEKCQAEFDKVRNYVYPTYNVEVVTDSTITITDVDKLSDMYESYTSTSEYSTISSDTGVRRNLLRSSAERQKEIDQKEVNDEEERRLSTERQLQNWCYGLCDDAPRNWLILNGCSQECRLSRRLDGTPTIPSNNERDLQEDYTYATGSSTKILSGPGDTTASQFYATVKVVLDSKDPCQKILLGMTYQVIPLVVTLK